MSESSASIARRRCLPPVREYPECEDSGDGWRERSEHAGRAFAQRCVAMLRCDKADILMRKINARSIAKRRINVGELVARLAAVRSDLRRYGQQDSYVAEALILLREVAGRQLGQRPSDAQMRAAAAMLSGRVVELPPGESRPLAAALAAAVAAMAGTNVHVVTSNEQSARRDAKSVENFYRAIGLSHGAIVKGQTQIERRSLYERDVVYASYREIAFDYLRDRLVMGARPRNVQTKLRRLQGDVTGQHAVVLRGLQFAIVDCAASVLIDAARTPLALTRQSDGEIETVARISCRRLFRRYVHLAGIAASAEGIRQELASVFGLRVVSVSPAKRTRRLPLRIYRTAGEKWVAIVQRVSMLYAQGYPVLIGVNEQAGADALSTHLSAAGLEFRVLEAEGDAGHAPVSAGLDAPASIAIATGAAIDVATGQLRGACMAPGKLHVIVGEFQSLARSDRRFEAFCVQRAEPGSFERLVSLEDPSLASAAGTLWHARLMRSAWFRSVAGRFLLHRSQRQTARAQASTRKRLARSEQMRERLLAFSGGAE